MKKRIAFVINYMVHGGPSNVIRNIILALDPSRFDITVITLFDENDPAVVAALKKAGVTVIVCTTLSRMKCLVDCAQEFQQIIRDGSYDVIHTHGFIPDILSARLRGTARRVSTLHNNPFEDYRNEYGWLKSRLFIPMHLFYFRRLDQVVACSQSVHQYMQGSIPGLIYVRNGIQHTICESSSVTRQALGLPQGARVFLFAGRLIRGKNVPFLIAQFVQCRQDDEYLLVLGEGEDEARCRACADDHVKMLGFRKDAAALQQIADVYVSASLSEGFSISVLEALDQGMGVLLSDIPAHAEVVCAAQDTYVGELFAVDTFASALARIRSHKLERDRIRAFKERMFSAESMAAGYQAVYFPQG